MGVLKIETAIRRLLLADATVAAGVGTRVRPLRATKGDTFPLVVYGRKNTQPEYNSEGVSNFVTAVVVLTWWGRDYDALCALAAAGEAALVPEEGVPLITYGGDVSTFDYLRLTDYAEGSHELDDGSESTLFYCSQEYEVGYYPQEE